MSRLDDLLASLCPDGVKYYTLEAIVKGKEIKFDKVFDSRNSAIDYMFDYLERAYIFDKKIEEEYLYRSPPKLLTSSLKSFHQLANMYQITSYRNIVESLVPK